MTKQQLRSIDKIKKLTEKLLIDPEKYEIKKFEVEELEYFVSVIVETGMKDDEGTLAEVFCRERAHLYIGKRGGITYPVSKITKDGHYKHYTKRFEGYSILQAVCDQRM